MLTGQRRREIAFLRWEEVDFERKLLTISADRVKNRAGAHEVPITPTLETILREAKANCEALDDKSGLVFPSGVTAGRPGGGEPPTKRSCPRGASALSGPAPRGMPAGTAG